MDPVGWVRIPLLLMESWLYLEIFSGFGSWCCWLKRKRRLSDFCLRGRLLMEKTQMRELEKYRGAGWRWSSVWMVADYYFWGLSGHEDHPSEEHVATQWPAEGLMWDSSQRLDAWPLAASLRKTYDKFKPQVVLTTDQKCFFLFNEFVLIR